MTITNDPLYLAKPHSFTPRHFDRGLDCTSCWCMKLCALRVEESQGSPSAVLRSVHVATLSTTSNSFDKARYSVIWRILVQAHNHCSGCYNETQRGAEVNQEYILSFPRNILFQNIVAVSNLVCSFCHIVIMPPPPPIPKAAYHPSGQICQNMFWNVVHWPFGSNEFYL